MRCIPAKGDDMHGSPRSTVALAAAAFLALVASNACQMLTLMPTTSASPTAAAAVKASLFRCHAF